MKTSFTQQNTGSVLKTLAASDDVFRRFYPGDPIERQPVHTVYGGAHLFRSGTASSLGAKALDTLRRYAPDPRALSAAMDIPEPSSALVYERVVAKLQREPVEDYRVDFEDGYGTRPDTEEDSDAARTAGEMARALAAATLPPFIGIRIKPLTPAARLRAIRTLDLFLTALLQQTSGTLPDGFVVTLPKVTHPGEVAALADLLEIIESAHALAPGSLRIEIMVETPQAIFNASGDVALPSLIDAARGRCRGAHFGAYDYTASCNITASQQNLLHPACDYARCAMQVALAHRGVFLSDAPTNVMPVSRDGDPAPVHRAWRLHVAHIRHSLENGFYQGWDLHPAQLPSRYAALYSFFLEALPATAERLQNFLAAAAQATLTGHVFDDAATGQGLLNFFLRGFACGALEEHEVRASGITLEDLRTRSFPLIIERRRNIAH